MILWRGYGDLLQDADNTQLCPINAMGAMGKGLALTMRQAYPDLFTQYRTHYHPSFSIVKEDEKRARQLKEVTCHTRQGRQVSVLLFCTKVDWKQRASMDLIVDNLNALATNWRDLGIEHLSLPLIGSGEGRLPARTIEYLIDKYLGDTCELPVKLYLGT